VCILLVVGLSAQRNTFCCRQTKDQTSMKRIAAGFMGQVTSPFSSPLSHWFPVCYTRCSSSLFGATLPPVFTQLRHFRSSATPSSADYYEILGVSRNATTKEIKKAYRQLAKKYHPDLNKGDESCQKKFAEITAAYETLSDEQKRKSYDMFGDASFHEQAGSPYGFDAADFGDLGDIFSTFFGGDPMSGGRGSRRQRQSKAGEDIQVQWSTIFMKNGSTKSRRLMCKFLSWMPSRELTENFHTLLLQNAVLALERVALA